GAEPIRNFPIRPVNVSVRGWRRGALQSEVLTMRFLPRVNGQNMSDGDKPSDMWVLFNAASGAPIAQPPVIEAAPFPITANPAVARKFSPIWELHILLVDPHYDPTDPAQLIDSALKVATSPFVVADMQTNVF